MNSTEFALDPMQRRAHALARMLIVTCSLPIVILGTVGNLLSIVVIIKGKLSKLAVAPFLVCLGIADTITLYTGILFHWYRYTFGEDTLENSVVLCRFLMFSFVAFRWTSAWIVVAMTAQRLGAILFPIKARLAITWRVSLIASLAIWLLSCISALHILCATYPNSDGKQNQLFITCAKVHMLYVSDILSYFELIIGLVFPFSLLVVFNALIIYALAKHKKTSVGNQSVDSKVGNLTTMLLAVSVVFLVLNLPTNINLLLGFTNFSKGEGGRLEGSGSRELLFAISTILQSLNHAINFVVYAASGPRFRFQLRALVCKTPRVEPDSSVIRCNTERHF